MKGYALEVNLVEWECSCKDHSKGVCEKPSSNQHTVKGEVYFGQFGVTISNLAEALKKFDRIVREVSHTL